jgi:3-deoxy-manno-octulosonate cytidylyltransferase (CMP-KDO synthetase)
LKHHSYFKHIGIYAYRPKILQELTLLKQSDLEKAESLEQLRWLENGYKIKIGITGIESLSVDTPEDLEKARNLCL